MPELPEVETIRRGLEKHLVGLTITEIDVRLPRLFFGDKADILDAEIIQVERFGKGLVIHFNNEYSLAIHVKMTGQLIFEGSQVTKETEGSKVEHSKKVMGKLPNKYTHVIFKLKVKNQKLKVGEKYVASLRAKAKQSSSKGKIATASMNPGNDSFEATLFYNDIRQFGWLKVIKTSELKTLSFFRDLGPEPLKDLDLATFKQIIKPNKGSIKPLLMEQKKIGGIGNIYANDALWLARINPKRSANSLSETESRSLFEAIESVLQKSISLGGASETNFVNALGQEGQYQKHFLVYGQVGKNCPRCGAKILREVVGGRGTFYCPACQS